MSTTPTSTIAAHIALVPKKRGTDCTVATWYDTDIADSDLTGATDLMKSAPGDIHTGLMAYIKRKSNGRMSREEMERSVREREKLTFEQRSSGGKIQWSMASVDTFKSDWALKRYMIKQGLTQRDAPTHRRIHYNLEAVEEVNTLIELANNVYDMFSRVFG